MQATLVDLASIAFVVIFGGFCFYCLWRSASGEGPRDLDGFGL